MALLTSIPIELIDVIIDHLHDDHEALRATSVVSRSFLPRSQMHLFSMIHISLTPNRHSLERLQKLHNIFLISPHLALYVQDVHLAEYKREDYKNKIIFPEELLQTVPHVLQLLRCARRVNLTYMSSPGNRRGPDRRWINQSESLKMAILALCRSQSVFEINLSHIQDFPISIFALCSGLKKLVLVDVTFDTYNAKHIEDDLGETVESSTKSHLEILEMDQSFSAFFPLVAKVFQHPTSRVRMSGLRGLKIVGPLPLENHPVWDDIYGFTSTLECLMWNQATDWKGRTVISRFYAEPLNLTRIKNLRFLVLKFLADINKYGIIPNLDWLSESLHRLRWNNRIEEITIILIYESWNRDNTNALLSVWTKHLDSVISTGFPVIKRIRIILPDFADRVKKFVEETKPQLGLQEGQYFHIEPWRNNLAAIWKETLARAGG